MEGSPTDETLAFAMPVFMELYADNVSKRSRLYPGVLEGLDYLDSIPEVTISCVTNKPEAFTGPLLKSLGIFDGFEVIVSGDTLSEKKPHPLPLLHTAEALGVTGYTSSIPVLFEAINDKIQNVSIAALNALESIGCEDELGFTIIKKRFNWLKEKRESDKKREANKGKKYKIYRWERASKKSFDRVKEQLKRPMR